MKIVSETYTYKKVGNCLLKADVYKSVKAYSPAIVFIHGGALILGSRKSINLEQVELFTQNGYTIVSIDYRLAPETKLESIVEDVYAAIKWIKVMRISRKFWKTSGEYSEKNVSRYIIQTRRVRLFRQWRIC